MISIVCCTFIFKDEHPRDNDVTIIQYRKWGRFAGLNIHSFSHMKFSWKYFSSALASSVYYLL